jgi:TonB family protein
MHHFIDGPKTARGNLMRSAIRLGCLAILAPMALFAAVRPPFPQSIADREHQVFKSLTRTAEFNSIRHISSIPGCEDVRPPEALTTPEPLLGPSPRVRKVKVSFIVGTDGHVRSPLILESAGMAGDHRVLQTVRTWRYRPATCNGVPAETEGNIEFSSR